MKKLYLLYKNSRLRTKLFTIFGLSSLVPIILIWIISTKVYENSMTTKTNEIMYQNLISISQITYSNLQMYTSMLYQMNQNDEMLSDIITLIDNPNDSAIAYSQILRRLKQYNNVDLDIRSISVICSNGSSVVYDSKTDSSVMNVWNRYSDLRMTPPYRNSEGATGMILTPTFAFLEKDGYEYYYHISRRMFDLNDLERGSVATVVISVDAYSLSQLCNPESAESAGGYNFIIGEDGTIICFPIEEYEGQTVKDDKELQKLIQSSLFKKNQRIEITTYQDSSTGWTFVNVYDKNELLKDVKQVQHLIVIVGIVVIALAVSCILLLLRGITESVSHVIEGMEQVSTGNLDVVVPVENTDEIGIVAHNFNQMTARVKSLIYEVTSAKDKERIAEIKALEAQINPHFLYNTLDSINWMAIENEQYEISKMLRDLGVILRYSVNKSNSKVYVHEMLDWLEKYMGLQKVRFDNSFEYTIRCDESAKDCVIHKLLVQPFVENAILHGIKEKEYGGKIKIDVNRIDENNRIMIAIEDNGPGISKELVNYYNDRDKAISNQGTSIGMNNVFSRIDMYYGESAVWKITSYEGVGTVVLIEIPIEKKDI